ncbi:hypothetical protein EYF80_062313 [Liparis tanakae]|uniref:Uncharacterized protein n=1 Tax=Liparis tanakae TaxID=230148 RepID=A0A4Z2EFK3_9TELE|nr:hypothetical protein EYF80_062313 [Liparis tanakae]
MAKSRAKTKPNDGQEPGQNQTKRWPRAGPKQNQTMAKSRAKTKPNDGQEPSQNKTKRWPRAGPKQNQTMAKSRAKTKPNDGQEPKPNQTMAKSRAKTKPNDGQEPKQNQTKRWPRAKTKQNQTMAKSRAKTNPTMKHRNVRHTLFERWRVPSPSPDQLTRPTHYTRRSSLRETTTIRLLHKVLRCKNKNKRSFPKIQLTLLYYYPSRLIYPPSVALK